jgi:hypothetical protein
MIRIGLALLLALAAAAASAQGTPAAATQSEAAAQPSLDDPRFRQQLALLEERLPELEERDVVILTDTDPAAQGPLRQALRPRGFGVVLIDTDGVVAQRHPTPVTARELINLIDRMPSRRQETGSRRR